MTCGNENQENSVVPSEHSERAINAGVSVLLPLRLRLAGMISCKW
jgi:hypothetical protein